jgi:hypothetical protein
MVFSPPLALQLHLLNTPTRVYDSRTHDGPLGTDQSRNITVTGWYDGIEVPLGIRAVLCDLTAVAPSGAGFLVMLEPGAGYAGTSNLNFSAGQSISNNVTCGVLGYPWFSSSWVWVANFGAPTDLIVDVFGYYE